MAGGPALVRGTAAAAYGGRPVLSGLTLTVRAGERVALMGRSGAGTSTLIGQAPDRVALVPQAAARVRPLPVVHTVPMGRLDRRLGARPCTPCALSSAPPGRMSQP